MSCTKCGSNTSPCGCGDKPLTTIPVFPCPPDVNCPTPEPCDEIFNAACISYLGPEIVDLGITPGMRFDQIIQILALSVTNPGCIVQPTTCLSVSTLALNQVTNMSIVPSWVLVPTAINYQIEYKLSTNLVWTLNPLLPPTATQDLISGLVPNTSYDVRINAICSFGNCYSVTLRILTLP
jgi:hypothetical protein